MKSTKLETDFEGMCDGNIVTVILWSVGFGELHRQFVFL